MPQATLDTVLEDWTTAPIPERTRAALNLIEHMTKHPLDIDATFIAKLASTGLDEAAIREAANVGFHYNFINRVADAFDFPVPKGNNINRLASILNTTGKRMKGSSADQIWVRGEDGRIRPPEVEMGRNRMLTTSGTTATSLRVGVDGFVTMQWEHLRENVSLIPNELHPFLKKLALYAYRITDKNIEELREAGYHDEMIYEITLVGSFAAALVGLEKVYEALYDPTVKQTPNEAIMDMA